MVDRARASNAITEFLRAIGRDPETEPDLVATGDRVANAFLDELLVGEGKDPRAVLDQNRLPIAGKEDLILVRDLSVATMCPHHLMPATGTATVAFAPRDHIVGIGALGDLVEILARRLTLQETIGERVVDALFDQLSPSWAGCRLALTHSCLVVRDEKRRGALVETVALRGEVSRDFAYRVLGAVP